MRNFGECWAVSFSSKCCSTFAEKAKIPLVFMYHEAMNAFLGSRNVLNLVYFGVFKKYAVPDTLPHTNRVCILGMSLRLRTIIL